MEYHDIWVKLINVMDIMRELHHKENLEERPPLHTTIAEAKVMHCVLFSKTNGCSVKEIAERLGVTQGAASQIIDKGSPLCPDYAFESRTGTSSPDFRVV